MNRILELLTLHSTSFRVFFFKTKYFKIPHINYLSSNPLTLGGMCIVLLKRNKKTKLRICNSSLAFAYATQILVVGYKPPTLPLTN